MAFQTLQYKLSETLAKTWQGEIQLPDFQRGYVWDDERIRSLLVTIVEGHPLGVVMMLETGGDHVKFMPKPFEGSPIVAGTVDPGLLVLDGQQRLTSLGQALSGDGVVHTVDDRKYKIIRKYFIDIPTAIATFPYLDEAVKSVPGDGVMRSNFNKTIELDVSTKDKQIAAGYFPVSLLFTDEGTSWLFEYYTKNPAAQQFLDAVVTPTKSYTLPVIQLDKSTSKESIATVFEKVNQGGMKLTVFELLTAKFAGDVDYYENHQNYFRLRDDWAATRRELDKYSVLDKFESDDFLQAITLLSSNAGQSATTARKEEILRLELDDYLTWAPKVVDALIWTAGFMDSLHIHVASDLPYPKQLVPLAAIRALVGDRADVHGVDARIRRWFWSGVFGELYGGAIETRFARDLEHVPGWADDESGTVASPKTVDDANFVESRLHSMRTRNSAAYKGVYALLMSLGTRDWLKNQKFDRLNMSVDIHHIFPKSWCLKHKIDPVLRESIVNKTPLAKKTNIRLGGAAPSAYLPKLQNAVGISEEDLATIIAAHQIDVDALRTDRFDDFFTARRRRLCRLISAAMDKPVGYDMSASALSGGSEGVDAFVAEADDPEDEDIFAEGKEV